MISFSAQSPTYMLKSDSANLDWYNNPQLDTSWDFLQPGPLLVKIMDTSVSAHTDLQSGPLL